MACFGRLTRNAVLAFQADNSLPGTGDIDAAVWSAFNTAKPCSQPPERLATTVEQLRSKGSETVKNADRSKLAATVSSILGGLGIFNSAFVEFANSRIPHIPTAPDKMAGILNNISALLAQNHKSIDIEKIRALFQNLSNGAIPRDLIPLLDQIRQTIPKEVLVQDPVLASLVKNYDLLRHAETPLRTIFDSFMTGGVGNIQVLYEALAAITGSMLPGFGGSVVALALALFIRYFGTQIINIRLQEHVSGQNLKR